MPRASIGQQKGPNSLPGECLTARRTMDTSKVERIGPRSFASSAIFTWPLTNWLPLLQASRQIFAGKMFPQPTGSRTCFQDLVKSQSTDFYATGKTNLLLIIKNMLILMVLILMNKDVCESRYKDLKFMVWNHSYTWTNLILRGGKENSLCHNLPPEYWCISFFPKCITPSARMNIH